MLMRRFHARFDAKKRLYRYVMYEGNYQPHLANYALHIAPWTLLLCIAVHTILLEHIALGFLQVERQQERVERFLKQERIV